jgi:hypothetical protein
MVKVFVGAGFTACPAVSGHPVLFYRMEPISFGMLDVTDSDSEYSKNKKAPVAWATGALLTLIG